MDTRLKNLENKDDLNEIFYQHKPTKVVNLAAQAGVRHSLVNPQQSLSTSTANP